MKSLRHLIKCQCFLPHLKNKDEVFQFLVFSIIDDEDNVKIKFAQCTNCGVVHRVYEIGKSEIIQKKEFMSSIVTIDDLKASFEPKLISLLEKHEIHDVSLWEEIKFILDNESWGSFVVLSREREGNEISLKLLKIISRTMFIIDSEIRTEII